MGRAVVLARRVTKIDTIEIDSCLDESHEMSNTVTDHPVEEGFNISDHSRPNPDRVTLRCFVSNTPLSSEQRKRSVRSGDIDFETSSASGVEIGAADGRGANAYTQLKKLRDEGTLIEVVTTLRTYGVTATEGVTIENVTITRTRENFDGLEFTMTLKQIKIVKNKRGKDVRERQARKPKNAGQKTVDKQYGPEEQKKTALQKILKIGK